MYKEIAQAILVIIAKEVEDEGIDVDYLSTTGWNIAYGAATFDVGVDVKGNVYNKSGDIVLPLTIEHQYEHHMSAKDNALNLDVLLQRRNKIQDAFARELAKQDAWVNTYVLKRAVFGFPYLASTLPGVYAFSGELRIGLRLRTI
jgi:hypothetical protein